MKTRHLLYICILCLTACTPAIQAPQEATPLQALPDIFPDYVDVTIPPQVAPLRFMLNHPPEEAIVSLTNGTETMYCRADEEGQFRLDEAEWAELLQTSIGKAIQVQVYERKGTEWMAYHPFRWEVSADEADPYLMYRLIEPGYELWNRMGIYQRSLASYTEKPVIQNAQTGHNCINCHSFARQNPDRMLFHMRGASGGTYLSDHGQLTRLDGKVSDRIRSLVYPSWHPSGRFVAFSTNHTRQAFHMNDRNRIEVFDQASDVLLYDVERNEVITTPQLAADGAFETFPAFSADGQTLYFCAATARPMPESWQEVRYNLCAVRFDADTRTFAHTVDTLYPADAQGQSVSFPRPSPDGRWLAFTLSAYGNFSIWHREADLYLMDLNHRTATAMSAANSPETESYHSWSSNGRWIVFSSRRVDGLYTHPHLAHIDCYGHVSKPFVLPQADAAFYRTFLYSFNIPEFARQPVSFSVGEISDVLQKEAVKISFKE